MKKTASNYLRQCSHTLEAFKKKVLEEFKEGVPERETELCQVLDEAISRFKSKAEQFSTFANRRKRVPNKVYRYMEGKMAILKSGTSQVAGTDTEDYILAVKGLLSVVDLKESGFKYQDERERQGGTSRSSFEFDGETITLFASLASPLIGLIVTVILSFCKSKWNIFDGKNGDGVDITLQIFDYVYGLIPVVVGVSLFLAKRKYPEKLSATVPVYSKISASSLAKVDKILCAIYGRGFNRQAYREHRKEIRENKDFSRARKSACYLDPAEYCEALRNSSTREAIAIPEKGKDLEAKTLQIIQDRAKKLYNYRVKKLFLIAGTFLAVATVLYFVLPQVL